MYDIPAAKNDNLLNPDGLKDNWNIRVKKVKRQIKIENLLKNGNITNE